MQTSKKKKLIVANSFLLLFLTVGCVFAWFATNYSNEIDSNQVEVVAGNALELSLTGNDWKSNIDLATDPYSTEWFQSIKFTDITGKGDGNFLRPALTQGDNGATVNPDIEWSNPTYNKVDGDYVKFTLYMRSKDPIVVKLGDGSYVKPIDEYLRGSSVKNPSNGTGTAMYSKDIVVGAVRVGVNNDAGHMFTWIPRPDIYVNTTGNITYDNILLNQTTGDSFKHHYYDSSKFLNTLPEASTVKGTITAGTAKTLATLTGTTDEFGYYTDSVDFYIWLEGCDNEARRAFVGGKFKVYLNIVSEDTAG